MEPDKRMIGEQSLAELLGFDDSFQDSEQDTSRGVFTEKGDVFFEDSAEEIEELCKCFQEESAAREKMKEMAQQITHAASWYV